jgi:hypothetical protein
MAGDVRLIVTDTSTAARTLADRIAAGGARGLEVHRVPVFEAEADGLVTRVIGLGGLLFAPHGDPPRWAPARRAPANALRMLARSAESLLIAVDDPLLAVQARDVACEGRPLLMRTARAGDPWSPPRHVDDLAAQARAAALEADAVFAAHLAPLDAELRRGDLAALGIAGPGPVTHRALRDLGAGDDAVRRLAERGYLVGDPAFRSPAGTLVCEAVDPRLLDPATGAAVDAWIDAVGRGALTRDGALTRVRDLVADMRTPVRPDGLDTGRLVGQCPECDDWMGGAREQLRCLGCGWTFHLPRQVEALAVPGARCEACRAPMIVPVIRGRRGAPRCPDTTGCPTRIEVRVEA